MKKKDFQDKARRIRSLINKDDGEFPISKKILDKLFQNIDPAELFIAQKEYLLRLGAPDDTINDDIMAGLTLAINIDEWAPALFRLLGMKKKRMEHEKKRIVTLDTLDPVDDTSALEIENWALRKQKINRLILSPPNSNTIEVLKIIFENPETGQKEIAEKLGISQGTVSKTFQQIRKRLNS